MGRGRRQPGAPRASAPLWPRRVERERAPALRARAPGGAERGGEPGAARAESRATAAGSYKNGWAPYAAALLANGQTELMVPIPRGERIRAQAPMACGIHLHRSG